MGKWSVRWIATMIAAIGTGVAAQTAAPSAASAPAPEQAVLVDSVQAGDIGKASFFVVKRANGEDLRTSIEDSLAASRGLGRRMRVVVRERPLRAGKATLRLVATVVFAAPIESIFSRSQFVTEGDVDVELKPGMRYRVNGVLDDFKREVWLEEESTGRIIGKKVVQSPNAEAMAAMASADRYACCNLRYEGNWISDRNFTGQPFIPAGARTKVLGWGRNRVHVNIEGRLMSAGADSDFEQLTREQFADRIFVKEDPKAKMERYPSDVQEAIVKGRVMPGMTREQVLIAIGHPRADRTPLWRQHAGYIRFPKSMSLISISMATASWSSSMRAAG